MKGAREAQENPRYICCKSTFRGKKERAAGGQLRMCLIYWFVWRGSVERSCFAAVPRRMDRTGRA